MSHNGKGSLTFVGTGILAGGHPTAESVAEIRTAERLLFLVADPVSEVWLRKINPEAESLRDTYADGKDRRLSYDEMVARILAPVRQGKRVCVALYGHPGVFVNPSHEALRIAREEGHQARMLPGVSAEDCLFADLWVDPAAHGCLSYEATDFLLRRRPVDPSTSLILWQVGGVGVGTYKSESLWSREGLRVLQEALLAHYPADHVVVIYEAATFAVCVPRREEVALSALGDAAVSIITTLYVPPSRRGTTDLDMARRLGMLPATSN